MIVNTMLLSGAVAGLVGHAAAARVVATPTRLTSRRAWASPGIAIALLGRNNPIGIAFGALLWAFLDSSATRLELRGHPQADRPDHAGHDRAVRGHRLRDRPPLPHPGRSRADVGRQLGTAEPVAGRRGRRHEPAPPAAARRRRPRRPLRPRRRRSLGATRHPPAVLASVLLLLLSFVRIITGADDLTSAGTVAAASGLAVPIAMAASAVCGPSAPAWSTSASRA